MSPGGRPTRKSVHERLADEVDALANYGGLPKPEEAREIWRTIWFHEAHNSTAIEGNTLVLKQVETLLSTGQTVGGKELKEYLEVQGYADAARWVYEQARSATGGAPPVSIQDLRHIHHLAMTPVWAVAPHPDATDREKPGSFREHDLHPFEKGMQPSTFPLIHAAVSQWAEDTKSILGNGDPVCVRIAHAHAAFERIHPFIDGNGRTGRLVLNLMLTRLGYPPAIIQKKERPQYLRALQQSDAGDDGPLGEMIARAVLDNLMRFLLPAIAGDVKLLPLEALATDKVSLAALRQAAERGRLNAKQDARGRWRSSKKWVSDYVNSRYIALKSPRKARSSS